MLHSHQLTSNHQDFLNQNRTDPITGEKIEEGHTVVVCAACKSAFFIESWEYLGHSHCDQTETLKFLPLPQTLYLKANDKYTQEVLSFGFADSHMFMGNDDNSGCLISFLLSIVSFIFAIVIGNVFSGGVGFSIFIVGIVLSLISGFIVDAGATPKNIEDKSITEMENLEASLNLFIDYKSRGLEVQSNKTKVLRYFFAFEDMIEFKYHIIYHPNTELGALYCQLQIRITMRQQFSTTYFATIHRDTIPEWSEFISKLPTDLRIINTPFQQ
ncbi:hypothetical protein [Bernardetia sp.]|uniref:hypothetical protein n=1 Tax=Bernardetia sp. TaxID=1937974 RepID=UPI0025B95B8B|nr:hypothetical protein [Bernardetia sp.]